MNLDVSCDAELESWLGQLDEHIIAALASRSASFFKKSLSKDEIRGLFKKSCTPHEKNGVTYAPTVRTKVNTVGPRRVRAWTPEKIERELPEDLRGCELKVILTVRSVWFMQHGCGITFEVQNLVVKEPSLECPFN